MSDTPRTDAMWGSNDDYPQQKVVPANFARELERENAELKAECERERMRLAACGVVALADTPDSAKEARDMRPDYQSASCNDVARRVDECIALRAENAELRDLVDRTYHAVTFAISCDLAPAGIKSMPEAIQRCHNSTIEAMQLFPYTVGALIAQLEKQNAELRKTLAATRKQANDEFDALIMPHLTHVCPTCKSARYAEVYPSKTDPTGWTLYCRKCEEGCVSPLMVARAAIDAFNKGTKT